MNKLLLNLIVILHTLYTLFVIVTPFIGTNYFLLIHSIIVPFMIFHWLINDNTCALTLFEQKLREQIYGSNINKEECFTCKLIEPVYDFKSNYASFSSTIYFVTVFLWSFSVYKLYYKYKSGEIQSFKHLMQYAK